MIGTKVLALMRVTPAAYSYGVVVRKYNDELWQVDMPWKGKQLSQAFRRDQLLICQGA